MIVLSLCVKLYGKLEAREGDNINHVLQWDAPKAYITQ